MTLRQHERAIEHALRAGDDLGALFDRMGHSDAPRGRIVAAYRAARLALANALTDPQAIVDILGTLRRGTRADLVTLLRDAVYIGQRQAERDASAYELPLDADPLAPPFDDAATAVLAILDAQIAGVRGLAINGLDEGGELMLGTDSRAGILTPGNVIREAAKWLTLFAVVSYSRAISRAVVNSSNLPASDKQQALAWVSPTDQWRIFDVARAAAQLVQRSPFAASFLSDAQDMTAFGLSARVRDLMNEYGRQAIAAIDERTTETCCWVHGQWQAMGEPFKLIGEPRYADEMQAPPFHHACRTVVALVRRQDATDKLTAQLRAAARDELNARAQKKREKVRPVNALRGG